MTRLLHIDASVGAAGDMLLAALVDAGADPELVRDAIGAVLPGAGVRFTQVRRKGLRGLAATVLPPLTAADTTPRSWRQIREQLAAAALPDPVRSRSLGAFERLAAAEARVHGTAVDDVHFHEVGAVDSICDVVGCAAALVALAPERVSCSAVALGSGQAHSQHGVLPVPSPAVAELLREAAAPVFAGPAQFESCTPTGAALLSECADNWGPLPAMTVAAVGVGAGSADPSEHANILRVFVGDSAPGSLADAAASPAPDAFVLETNVDDMDPRLWPDALQALLAAGAADAWLTPILMKKGRPAMTLSVLVGPELRDQLAAQVLRHTTAIGLRVVPVGKLAADRTIHSVPLLGSSVRVKVAHLGGHVVNVQPEWADVAAVAQEAGVSAKAALAAAQGAATHLWQETGTPSDQGEDSLGRTT